MAGSPQYKVYSADKEYVASCKYLEDAAALVGLYGYGATVRWQHSAVLWQEGKEIQPAGESYDFAAQVMAERKEAEREKWRVELGR